MAAQYADPLVLPPVRGRHRNHALAQARRMRAARLVLSGSTYQQVADHLGYRNRGTVHRLVQPVLRQVGREGVQDAFELHIARLEKLLQAHYERAVAGDEQATKLVLQVLREEARAWGFSTGARATATEQDVDYEVIDPAELVRRARQRNGERPPVPASAHGVACLRPDARSEACGMSA